MPDTENKIPKRILASLMNSISAGVVPRTGAPYIAIGRNDEIGALLSDLEIIDDGGSTMRFLIGKYGSGKSFLIQLIRGYAMDRGFVTADADLSPERRICGAKGSGISTYRELLKNLSTKTSPEGGAMQSMIAKWLSSLQSETAASGISPESPAFLSEMRRRIFTVTQTLQGQVGGFDFAAVISVYYEAYLADDEDKKAACMRWLRGEYTTKTEARVHLPVGTIIDDSNWYDFIKLLAIFCRMIGYRGLVVFLDECVNLYKISNRISRENNYEMLLSMFNDSLQGRAPGLGLILGGTPQFLEDSRRGLFSYEALRSRLCDGQFSQVGYKNMLGPVIRLRRLSDNELYALLARVTKLHGWYYHWEVRVTDEEMQQFLAHCLSRIGADALITPREMIRDYISLLNILYQNPEAGVPSLLGNVTLSHDGSAVSAHSDGSETGKEITIDDIEL